MNRKSIDSESIIVLTLRAHFRDLFSNPPFKYLIRFSIRNVVEFPINTTDSTAGHCNVLGSELVFVVVVDVVHLVEGFADAQPSLFDFCTSTECCRILSVGCGYWDTAAHTVEPAYRWSNLLMSMPLLWNGILLIESCLIM
jgi:hypothetical protein